MFRQMEARSVVVTNGKLVELNFGSKVFDDADCQKLAKLADLVHLDLGKCQITDAGLDHLVGLTQLESLTIEDNQSITDAGIAKLATLTKLNSLNVGTTKITDKSLEIAGKLPALEKLSIAHAADITDAGLSNLDGLKNLKEVWLPGTAVTPAGVKKLEAAHPGILVHGFDDEAEEAEVDDGAAQQVPDAAAQPAASE